MTNKETYKRKHRHLDTKIEKLDQNAASFILQGVLDYLKR